MDNEFTVISASVSDRGLSEKRPENEDSFLEMPRAGIFAVADGVGGAQAGEVASQMAMEILGEAFANLPSASDAETVMRAAFERANTAIFQMAHELPQLANMATTVVALHLSGDIATIGHVGDSRLYRVDRDGEIHRETEDHSMVAEEVRAGRMTEEQAENHPSKNIISRALGAEATVEPDLKTIMVESGTAFLLCSDGITRHVADQEIRGVLTFGGTPADVCEYLKNLCYERGAEDNLTAVVVKMPAVSRAAAAPGFASEIDAEESTVTTARAQTSVAEDDLLGIEDLFPESPAPIVSNETIQIEEAPRPDEKDSPTVAFDGEEFARRSAGENNFTIFSGAAEDHPVETNGSPGLKRVLGSLLMLVIGGAVAIGIYHFVFVRPQLLQQAALPPITEMQSRNQQLSAFEENRRTVDMRPAEALTQFGASPSDAEDFFLVGRAHLLLGHYDEALKAFSDSRARIIAGNVDPNNKKTIETEIALATIAIGNSTGRTALRTELDRIGGIATSNSNAATNLNSARSTNR